ARPYPCAGVRPGPHGADGRLWARRAFCTTPTAPGVMLQARVLHHSGPVLAAKGAGRQPRLPHTELAGHFQTAPRRTVPLCFRLGRAKIVSEALSRASGVPPVMEKAPLTEYGAPIDPNVMVAPPAV